MAKLKRKVVSILLATAIATVQTNIGTVYNVFASEVIGLEGLLNSTSGSSVEISTSDEGSLDISTLEEESLEISTLEEESLEIYLTSGSAVYLVDYNGEEYIDFSEDVLVDGKLQPGNYYLSGELSSNLETTGEGGEYNLILDNVVRQTWKVGSFIVNQNDKMNIIVAENSDNVISDITLYDGSGLTINGHDTSTLETYNIATKQDNSIEYITIIGGNMTVIGVIGATDSYDMVSGPGPSIGEINIIDVTLEHEGRIGLEERGYIGSINIDGGRITSSEGIGSGSINNNLSTEPVISHVEEINITGSTGDYFKQKDNFGTYGKAFIGTAKVTYTGMDSGAVISSVGKINITGNDGYEVRIYEGADGAAIGTSRSEYYADYENFDRKNSINSIDNITISGDNSFTLTIESNEENSWSNNSAAIGTGVGNQGYSYIGSINIEGGTIKANNSGTGAVIGTGSMGTGSQEGEGIIHIGEINISGGNVFAKNTGSAAAIGLGDINGGPGSLYRGEIPSGEGAFIDEINITGGNVTAIGGKDGAAGIGAGISASRYSMLNSQWVGGYDYGIDCSPMDISQVKEINITGGNVTAIGGKTGGAGIGKSFSEDNSVGSVTIGNNAVVKAYAVSEPYDKFTFESGGRWDLGQNENFYLAGVDTQSKTFRYLPGSEEKFVEMYGYGSQSRYAIGMDSDDTAINGNIVNTYLTDSIYYDPTVIYENINNWDNPFVQDFSDTIKITAYEVDGDREIELELPYGYTSFAYNAPAGTEFYHVFRENETNELKYLEVIDERDELAEYKGYAKVPTLNSIRATWVQSADLSEAPVLNPMIEQQETISGTGIQGATVNLQINVGDEVIFVDNILVDENGNWSINVEDIKELEALEPGYLVIARQVEEGKAGSFEVKEHVTPVAPIVNYVIVDTDIITGTAASNAEVIVIINGKEYTVTADENGNWTLDSSAIDLVVGNLVTVKQEVTAVDGKLLISDETSTVVLRKPDVPVVENLTDGDTEIKGTGEPGAVIEITINPGTPDEIILTTVVDEDGNWSVEVTKPLDGGDEVVVNQTVEVEDGIFATSDDVTVIVEAVEEPVGPVDPIEPVQPEKPEIPTVVDPHDPTPEYKPDPVQPEKPVEPTNPIGPKEPEEIFTIDDNEIPFGTFMPNEIVVEEPEEYFDIDFNEVPLGTADATTDVTTEEVTEARVTTGTKQNPKTGANANSLWFGILILGGVLTLNLKKDKKEITE